MADKTYQTKVYLEQGSERLVLKSGGKIAVGDTIERTTEGTNLVISGLPTADPSVDGALWSDSGVVTVSAG